LAPESSIQALQTEAITEPVGRLEKTARLAGEFIAPIPELAGIPGVGFLIAAGEKAVGRAVAKVGAPLVERIGKPIAKTISDTKVFNATKDLFTKIGKNATDAIVDRVADIIKFASGVSEGASKRLMRRGEVAWKKPFVEAGKEGFTEANRRKASEGITEGFSAVGKRFDQEVAPALKSKTKIETTGLKSSFNDALVEADLIREIREVPELLEEGILDLSKLAKKKKITPGLTDIEGELIKSFAEVNKLLAVVEKEGSINAAHAYKKSLSNLINSKRIKENPAAKKLLIDHKKDVVARIENVSENYRLVNERFRDVFKLEDLIGNKLTPQNIERTAFNLFGKGQSFIRENLVILDDLLPVSKRFLDDLLDESAVKQFIDLEPQWFRGLAAAGIGGRGTVGLGALAGLAVTSPRALSVGIRGTQAAGRRLGALTGRATRFPISEGVPASVAGKTALQELTTPRQR